MDSPARSLAKALIWTLFGILMMALTGLYFTGSLWTGGVMALVNSALGLLCYLAYERVWSAIRWGRDDGV